jgi:hypothetical protein
MFAAASESTGGHLAASIALIDFGTDSLIEALAGFVVLWLFTEPGSGQSLPSGGRSS